MRYIFIFPDTKKLVGIAALEAEGQGEPVRDEEGNTAYKCTQCGKIFKRVAYLRSHLKLHAGTKPYKYVI